jgi:hypothetical protein
MYAEDLLKGGRSMKSTGSYGAPAIVLALTLVIGAAVAPAPAAAQSDIMVVSFTVNPPSAQPGGVVYIDFTIQNVGPGPTAVGAILNYIFIWDSFNNIPITQLLPDATGNVHTMRPLTPGEMDVITGAPLTLPASLDYDTTITLGLYAEYPDLEPELDELNNFSLVLVPIEPLQIPFDETGHAEGGTVDLPYYVDLFEFSGNPGDIVYSEGLAAELGSALDPQVALLGPWPDDTLLTPEGNFAGIDPDSRIVEIDLPASPDEFRLEMYGETGTTGFYELRLQKGIPETEPNDDPSMPEPLSYGEVRAGALDYTGDIDWYSFTAGFGDILIIDVDASEAFEPPPDSTLDPIGVLLDPMGDTLLVDDDTDDMDPYFYFITPMAGEYRLGLEGAPGGGIGDGFPGFYYAFKIKQITGVMKPDLAVMNLQPLPGPIGASDTAHVVFETWNVGGLATFQDGAMIDIVLSTDAAIDAGDQFIEIGDFFGDIDPGTFHPTSVDVRIPWDTPPGSYFLGIILDPTDIEVEEDEGNNTAVLPIDVDPYTDAGEPGLFPDEIALFRSYPNPSTGRTVISYDLPAGAAGAPSSWKVEISVYDVAGRRVAKLVDAPVPSGRHQVVWDGRANGRRLPSGVYFCRMRVGSIERSFRIVLIR